MRTQYADARRGAMARAIFLDKHTAREIVAPCSDLSPAGCMRGASDYTPNDENCPTLSGVWGTVL